MTEPTWRLPPIPVLFVGVALIACAEVGGGAMAQFKLELARWARGTMLARPQMHGLVGVRDVDEQILDEALVKFDAGLRLFHLHAEGLGTIIIVTTMVATSLITQPALRKATVVLITAGGAGYPLGYLLCFRLGSGIVGLWIGLSVGLVVIGLLLLGTWTYRTGGARLRSSVA